MCPNSFEDYIVKVESENEPKPKDNPYQFEAYQETIFDNIPRDGYGHFENCIIEIINNEYPLHYELLCQKIAPLLANKKAT